MCCLTESYFYFITEKILYSTKFPSAFKFSIFRKDTTFSGNEQVRGGGIETTAAQAHAVDCAAYLMIGYSGPAGDNKCNNIFEPYQRFLWELSG
jgi:hypothetical protein